MPSLRSLTFKPLTIVLHTFIRDVMYVKEICQMENILSFNLLLRSPPVKSIKVLCG